jgi:hypothetical protein
MIRNYQASFVGRRLSGIASLVWSCRKVPARTFRWDWILAVAPRSCCVLHGAFHGAIAVLSVTDILELDRDMADLEPACDLGRRVCQHRRRTLVPRKDQMSGQCDLRGAHRPDVQIVNTGDLRQRGQVRLDCFGINVRWHCIE